MIELNKSPLNTGDNPLSEEDIQLVTELFVIYCKAFKAGVRVPGARSKDNTARIIPDWERCIDKERLMHLYNKPKPLDTNNHKNIIHGRNIKELKKPIKDIASILEKKWDKADNSGEHYYPRTGFMGWHTNASAPCERLYITYSDTGESFFRYYDEENDEIITDWDNPGLTFRLFPITDKPPHFWHCVGSNCNRISLGYRLNQRIRRPFRGMP